MGKKNRTHTSTERETESCMHLDKLQYFFLKGDKPQVTKEAGVLPPLNPQLAQLIVEKIREELPKPSEEITENLFKSFVR